MLINKFKKTNRGQAVITAVVFFLFISITVILGITKPIYNEIQLTRDLESSKGSYYLAESGQEDLIYRIKNAKIYSNSESLTIGVSSVITNVYDDAGTKIVTSNATSSNLVRKLQTALTLGEGISFNYGVQVGDGGLYMKNTSSVSGNVYSNGPITADNSPSINGDAISAGPTGLIEDMIVTGSAFAQTIRDSNISGDAYYEVISGTSVGGVSYPGSPNQATTSLPIPDATIEDWKNQALAGGESSSCSISSNMTLGPLKFNCSTLTISGSPTLTFEGPIWVDGNIEIQNSAELVIPLSYGSNSIPIIAHNEANESTSGKILLKNSVSINAPSNNFILFISMNNDAEENGGSTLAIEVKNSVNGDLLVYAPHGIIEIQNSVDLKEVTAYRLKTQNSAEIIYDSGLASLLFSSGPSGGYAIDSWQEVE